MSTSESHTHAHPGTDESLQNTDGMDMDSGDVAVMLGSQLIQNILAGASLDEVQFYVKATDAPVWYQDEVEGISALHAAAYVRNKELVKWLIKEGAVWNAGEFCRMARRVVVRDEMPVSEIGGVEVLMKAWVVVDNMKNTAGDIALSFNDEEIYALIRDAGIRAGSFRSSAHSFQQPSCIPHTGHNLMTPRQNSSLES